jgi:hypothetical protein
MINLDMWYGNKKEDIQKLDCFFYPNSGQYRGNVYINNKAVGDYTATDSIELENYFPQIIFNWD